MKSIAAIELQPKTVTRDGAREILLIELGWKVRTVKLLLDFPPLPKEIVAGPYILKLQQS